MARVSCLIPCRLGARKASLTKQAGTHIAPSRIVASQHLLFWPQQEREAPGKPQLLASSSMSTPWSWGLRSLHAGAVKNSRGSSNADYTTRPTTSSPTAQPAVGSFTTSIRGSRKTTK